MGIYDGNKFDCVFVNNFKVLDCHQCGMRLKSSFDRRDLLKFNFVSFKCERCHCEFDIILTKEQCKKELKAWADLAKSADMIDSALMVLGYEKI